MNPQATVAELLRDRHAELALYIVIMVNTPRFEAIASVQGQELFRQHLLYWWRLEESGNLFAAGPVEVGTPRQEGFAILMANSLTHAIELATAEPFHAAGWRHNSVRG